MHYKLRAHHFVLAVGVIGSFLAFLPVLTTPFRNDEWYIASFSRHAPVTLQTIAQVSSWELFGDPRFQPLSHLLLFFVHRVLGNSFMLFHLLSWVSHAVVGLLIYGIVKDLHGHKMTAALSAILFVTGFSHFDTVSWTYHLYIIHQTACFLFGFWIVLRGPSRLRWWQGVAGGILVGFASYFYEAGLAIPIFILGTMFWSHYKSEKSESHSNLIRVFSFAVCVVVGYGAFLGFHLLQVGSQISARVDVALFLRAARNSFAGLWSQAILGNLGFPPRHAMGDIFYLQGNELSFAPIVATGIFLAALASGLRRFRQRSAGKNRAYLLPVFLACAVSYYGIIAIGRFNLYVLTQARYFYLPDAFLVLAASWPMVLACSVQSKEPSKQGICSRRHILRSIARPQVWAIGAVCIVITLNACHVFGMCREIARTLAPVKDAIDTVEDFCRRWNGEKRLYVDFLPRNLAGRLFGGTHVALETSLEMPGILTRHVSEAQYVFTESQGIIPNPTFRRQKTNGDDFTLEFDYVMWGPFISVIDSPENTFRIRQLSAQENELLLRLTYQTGADRRECFVTARHPRHYVSHVVIQQQDNTLYAVEEGKVILVKPVGPGEVLWQDNVLFLGSRVVFPPQYCYLENFFACIGKARYDLQGMNVGDVISNPSLRAPMPALNSDPVYWQLN